MKPRMVEFDTLVMDAVCFFSPDDEIEQFRRRLRFLLQDVERKGSGCVTVRELLAALPAGDT